jgi:hypothetical protein
MPVGASPGTPQYSGTFIPEYWHGKILVKFWDALVLTAISNTDYQAGAGQGDTVHIRTAPTITTHRYYTNAELNMQIAETTLVDLLIDYARYFFVGCDDVQQYQSDIALMKEFSDNAGMQLKQDTETDIFANIYADAATYNAGLTAGYIARNINLGTTGTPLVVTTADVLNLIVRCKQCLGEYNAPPEDRWGVIPEWMVSNILLSELKDASLSGDGTSILRNGRQGRIANITLYESNKITSASEGVYTCFYPMFGQKRAMCFSANLNKVQKVAPSKSFQEGIKGLTVCGWKVLKPEALVVPYVREGT